MGRNWSLSAPIIKRGRPPYARLRNAIDDVLEAWTAFDGATTGLEVHMHQWLTFHNLRDAIERLEKERP